MVIKSLQKFPVKKKEMLPVSKFKPFEQYTDMGLLEKIFNAEKAHLVTLKESTMWDLLDFAPYDYVQYYATLNDITITKEIVAYIIVELETIKTYAPAKLSYPMKLDKLLMALFIKNNKLYKKLYTFQNGRYSSILNKNDYLKKATFTTDSNSVFYGQLFFHELPAFWKYHGKKSLTFTKKDFEGFIAMAEEDSNIEPAVKELEKIFKK